MNLLRLLLAAEVRYFAIATKYPKGLLMAIPAFTHKANSRPGAIKTLRTFNSVHRQQPLLL
jgi:hypothetical protein